MKTNNFKKIVFKKGKIMKKEYNIPKFEEMVIDFNEIILTWGTSKGLILAFQCTSNIF